MAGLTEPHQAHSRVREKRTLGRTGVGAAEGRLGAQLACERADGKIFVDVASRSGQSQSRCCSKCAATWKWQASPSIDTARRDLGPAFARQGLSSAFCAFRACRSALRWTDMPMTTWHGLCPPTAERMIAVPLHRELRLASTKPRSGDSGLFLSPWRGFHRLSEP